MRTYSVPVGLLDEFLSLYALEGYATQVQHLGEPLGYFTTEVGELGQVVHLWKYVDMADRERRRAALMNDPAWLAYRSNAGRRGHVKHQTNSIMRQVDFAARTA
jgi:hypothetical protein